MKVLTIAKCWDCEIDIPMTTLDYLSDELLCYDCGMARCGY